MKSSDLPGMFGYITVNSFYLPEEEMKIYRSYYCGLCRALDKAGGIPSRATLSYDMTFLALLLSGIYDEACKESRRRCLIHPFKLHNEISNIYISYAADMNILLSYYDLRDDWKDDRKAGSLLTSSLLGHQIERIKKQYSRQYNAVTEYVTSLYECEENSISDIDTPAALTGRMLSEVFAAGDDIWKEDLKKMGFFLGKFIYLMDAFEDIDKDIKSGNYNPLKHIYDSEMFNDKCRDILMMQMSDCCRAFERLPVTDNVGILRNILYSGVWTAFARKINGSQENSNK